MARSRRGKHDGGHDNAERWLLTYSDMITLLMAFFIMMYSMSVVNLTKFREVAFSIRSGFGGVMNGNPGLLNSRTGYRVAESSSSNQMRRMRVAEERLKSYIVVNNLESQVAISRETRGMVISIASDGLLFNRGSAELTPAAHTLLTDLAEMLKVAPNDFQVEGHTCDLPISTAQFPSNWELSTVRACSVVRYLSTRGIPAQRMIATGYGETRPRAPNDTEAHRVLNRRVAVVLLDMPGNAPVMSGAELGAPRPGLAGKIGGQLGLPSIPVRNPATSGKASPNIPKVWDGESQGGP